MNLLNSYGTKENPKDRVLKILASAKIICQHSGLCSHCVYSGLGENWCAIRDYGSYHIPLAWRLVEKSDSTVKTIPEPKLSEVLDSLKTLTLEERLMYQI